MTEGWTCVCDHEDCPDDGYCTTTSSCYSFVTKDRDQRGCFDDRLSKMQCGSINSQHAAISCCYEQLCNHEVAVTLPSENVKPFLTAEEQAKLLLIGAISGGILVMALLVAGICWYVKRRRRKNGRYGRCDSTEQITALTADEHANTTTSAIEDTSGSGKGYTALIKRTIAKELVYVGNSPIGKGRYGEVWRGKCGASLYRRGA